MFVSIHIPKTAGTTLSLIFDHGCSRRIYYDYALWENAELQSCEPKYVREKCEALQRNDIEKMEPHRDFIQDRFEFIHGHFLFTKFEKLLPLAHFITCVRQPITRLVSHYYHILDQANDSNWLYRELTAGHLDLVDMAGLPFFGDLQCQFLAGRELEDYDFIFLSEQLPDSIYYFQLKYGFQRQDEYMNHSGIESVPHINRSACKVTPKPSIPDSAIRRAAELMESENELYRRAIEVHSRQVRAI